VSGLQLATEMRTAESGEFNDKILLSCGTFAIVRPKERSLGREVRGASLALVKETLGGPNSIALSVMVNTPQATLAVRGTHFWAGPSKGKYGVLLLKGKVTVSKR
jgi:hypothetical protein